MSVAGLVVLSAVCDVIMPDGEMKKYIKPILGFVLIVTVIRPIAGRGVDDIKFELPLEYGEVSAQVSRIELMGVREIYEEKLSKKAEEYLKNSFNIDASVEVSARDNKENFGEIEEIKIDAANVAPDIIQKLSEEFGVGPEKVVQGGEQN